MRRLLTLTPTLTLTLTLTVTLTLTRCAAYEATQRDSKLCEAAIRPASPRGAAPSAGSCEACTSTIKADGTPCRWFADIGACMAEGGIVGPGQTVCPHQNKPMTTGANRYLSTGKPRLTLTLTLTLTRSAHRPRGYERRRRRRGARPTAGSTSTGATIAGACPTVRWRAPGCGAPPTPRRRTARKRPHPRSSAPASSECGCPHASCHGL